MKRQYKAVQDLVEGVSEHWIARLGLDHWDVTHVFLEAWASAEEGETPTSAETVVRPEYMEARIKWYLPACARHSDEELEKVLVHELVHVLLSPEQALIQDRVVNGADDDKAYQLMMDRLEHATELVTKVLWRSR